MTYPYQPQHENAASAMNSLLLRHEKSIKVYEDFARTTSDDRAARFFNDLVEYRKSLLQQLKDYLSSSSSGVHTPSKQSQSYFNDQQDQVQTAITANNLAQMRDLAYENENALAHYLRDVIPGNGTPKTQRELLEKQAERVQEMVIKTDRYKTVG